MSSLKKSFDGLHKFTRNFLGNSMFYQIETDYNDTLNVGIQLSKFYMGKK